jgi:hypothetical protein
MKAQTYTNIHMVERFYTPGQNATQKDRDTHKPTGTKKQNKKHRHTHTGTHTQRHTHIHNIAARDELT